MKFCPKCGTRLRYRAQKPNPVLVCEKCGTTQPVEPSVTRPEEIAPEGANQLRWLEIKKKKSKQCRRRTSIAQNAATELLFGGSCKLGAATNLRPSFSDAKNAAILGDSTAEIPRRILRAACAH